jgi:predicted type IV restriction endonuclease
MSLEELLSQLCEQGAKLVSSNEEAAKQAAVIPVLSALGWDTSNSLDEVCPEYAVGTDRVDYCLKVVGKPRVFVEAKRPGENLEHHQEQLLRYAYEEGIALAALTTGIRWWFYLPMRMARKDERRFADVDILKSATGSAKQLRKFLSRSAVADGSAIRAAEDEIVSSVVPHAWAELCLDLRSSLIEQLRLKVKNLSGYEPDRAKLEMFLDRQSTVNSPEITAPDAGHTPDQAQNPFRPGSRFGQIYDALF